MEGAAAIPEAIRRLAEHPIVELPIPPNWERVEQHGAAMVVTPFPIAQVVDPADLAVEDVGAAVEAMRAVARDRGKTLLAWWIAPEHDAFVPHLEALGLVNEDSPGFEAIENAMALVTPPSMSVPEDVEVKPVESFDEFAGAERVRMEAFQMPAHMRKEIEAGLEQHFAEYQEPGNPGRGFIARLEGRIVGASIAVAGEAGVNLFGGCVLPDSRGRGVYQALLRARWDFAVQRARRR